MTKHHSLASDFLVRLRKIENTGLKARDIVVLYAVVSTPGMMGNQIAGKLGYSSRSNLQDGFDRLMKGGFMEDRRPHHNQQTPNDFHATQAGRALIADIVPQG